MPLDREQIIALLEDAALKGGAGSVRACEVLLRELEAVEEEEPALSVIDELASRRTA